LKFLKECSAVDLQKIRDKADEIQEKWENDPCNYPIKGPWVSGIRLSVLDSKEFREFSLNLAECGKAYLDAVRDCGITFI